MMKQEIKLPAKLVEYYRQIAELAGLPIETVLEVALAVGAWREIQKVNKK